MRDRRAYVDVLQDGLSRADVVRAMLASPQEDPVTALVRWWRRLCAWWAR